MIQSLSSGLVLGAEWRELAPSLGEALAIGIRNAVLDGRLRPSDTLPAERHLATQLAVSRGTVKAAYARLRAEGWLDTRQGSGSVIRVPASLRLRYAPISIDRPGEILDLRRAVPAAPHDTYVAAVGAALTQIPRLLLEDGEPGPGLPGLREQIAARFTAEGLPTNPDQILITAGARAAMNLLMLHLRPRAAVVESPTFFGIMSIIRHSAHRISTIAVTPQGWDRRHLADVFQRAAGGAAILVPDFHNPTGAVMSWEDRSEIAMRAGRADMTIIANEVMRDLDLREPPAPAPRIPRAVIVGSLSKTVWAGLRLGWIRGPSFLINELLLNPLSMVSVPPPMEQLIACELLPHLTSIAEQRVGELRRQRDYLCDALRGDEWAFTIPPGGLWLWLRHAHIPGDAIAAQAAVEGLALLPGSTFSLDGTLGSWLRFPFTAPVPALARAVVLLRRAVTRLS